MKQNMQYAQEVERIKNLSFEREEEARRLAMEFHVNPVAKPMDYVEMIVDDVLGKIDFQLRSPDSLENDAYVSSEQLERLIASGMKVAELKTAQARVMISRILKSQCLAIGLYMASMEHPNRSVQDTKNSVRSQLLERLKPLV